MQFTQQNYCVEFLRESTSSHRLVSSKVGTVLTASVWGPQIKWTCVLRGQRPQCGHRTQLCSHKPTWGMCTIVNKQWMQRRWGRLQSAGWSKGKHKISGTWITSMFSGFFFSFLKIAYWLAHSCCILTLVFPRECGAFRWSSKFWYMCIKTLDFYILDSYIRVRKPQSKIAPNSFEMINRSGRYSANG